MAHTDKIKAIIPQGVRDKVLSTIIAGALLAIAGSGLLGWSELRVMNTKLDHMSSAGEMRDSRINDHESRLRKAEDQLTERSVRIMELERKVRDLEARK